LQHSPTCASQHAQRMALARHASAPFRPMAKLGGIRVHCASTSIQLLPTCLPRQLLRLPMRKAFGVGAMQCNECRPFMGCRLEQCSAGSVCMYAQCAQHAQFAEGRAGQGWQGLACTRVALTLLTHPWPIAAITAQPLTWSPSLQLRDVCMDCIKQLVVWMRRPPA